MPRVTITDNNISAPSVVNTYTRESINPDLTVASALSNQSQILQSASNQLFNMGAGLVDQYKKAKDADYVSNSYTSASFELQGIEDELKKSGVSEGYTQQYINRAEKIYNSLIDKAPSIEAQRVLKAQFDQQKLSSYQRQSAYEKNQVVTEKLGNYQNSLTILSNQIQRTPDQLDSILGQNNQLLDSLRIAGVDKDTLFKLDKQSKQQLSKSMLQGIQPDQALALLQGGAFDATFDADNRQALESDFVRQIHSNLIEADKQAKAAQEKMINSLEVGIFNGQVTGGDLEQLRTSGNLTDGDYLKLVKSFNGKVEKQAETAANQKLVGDLINSGAPLDTSNKNVKEGLDSYFNSVLLPSIEGQNPSDKQQSILNFVTKAGAVPESLKGSVLAGLNSADPNTKIQSATLISQLAETNPAYIKDINEKDLAFSQKLIDYSGVMPFQDAVKAAQNQAYDRGSDIYKQKLQDIKESKIKFDSGKVNTSWFPSLTGTPSDVPEGMKNDWENLVKTFHADLNLPLDKAQDMAYKKVLSTWSATNVNGTTEYMKGAPEQYYGKPGQDNSWIRNQLLNDVTSLGRDIMSEDKVELHPMLNTLNRDKPSYLVYITKDGITDVLRNNNGDLLTWQPDPQREAQGHYQASRQLATELKNKMIIDARSKIQNNKPTGLPSDYTNLVI